MTVALGVSTPAWGSFKRPCVKCGVAKPAEGYRLRRYRYRDKICKDCQRIKQRKDVRKYYLANKERIITRHKDWTLKRKYGITIEDWNRILTLQGNRCPICKTSNPGHHGWQMDHCHKTETNRSLLCRRCNLILGLAEDNPELLRTAAEYLEVYNDIYFFND